MAELAAGLPRHVELGRRVIFDREGGCRYGGVLAGQQAIDIGVKLAEVARRVIAVHVRRDRAPADRGAVATGSVSAAAHGPRWPLPRGHPRQN